MTQEDKDLLLHDLCARISYELKGRVQAEVSTGTYDINSGHLDYTEIDIDVEVFGIQENEMIIYPVDSKYNELIAEYPYTYEEFIPYLRPMSSMTEDEYEEYSNIANLTIYEDGRCISNGKEYDWLNVHHFDYRGLIEKRLALEAPEGLYQ